MSFGYYLRDIIEIELVLFEADRTFVWGAGAVAVPGGVVACPFLVLSCYFMPGGNVLLLQRRMILSNITVYELQFILDSYLTVKAA